MSSTKKQSERLGRQDTPGRSTKARSVSAGRKGSSTKSADSSYKEILPNRTSPRVLVRKIDASPGRKEKATPSSKLSLNEQSETLLLATPELKLKPVKVLLSSSPKHVRERKSTSKPVVDLNAKDIIDIVEQKRHNKEKAYSQRLIGQGDTVSSVTKIVSSSVTTIISHSDKEGTTVTKETVVNRKEIVHPNNTAIKPLIKTFISIIFLLSIPLYALLICNKKSCQLSIPNLPTSLSSYFDLQASLIFISFMTVQLVLTFLPIGRTVKGLPLPSGARLTYRCNGLLSLVISLAMFLGLLYFNFPISLAYRKQLPLLITASLTSVAISLILLIRARYQASNIKTATNSGSLSTDFLLGADVSPRLGPIDFKILFKLHSGPIAWVFINALFVLQAYQSQASFPLPVVVVASCQLLYVIDLLWFEDCVLSTPGYTTNGLGFQIVCGSLVWVPFFFSLQCRYLTLQQPQPVPNWLLLFSVLLHVTGQILYRGSNSQKDHFKKHPELAGESTTILAAGGKRVLAGRWWSICRHPNYLGDILMAWSWSLPCGVQTIVPYFYPIYLSLLLIIRAKQEDWKCKQKYGSAWGAARALH